MVWGELTVGALLASSSRNERKLQLYKNGITESDLESKYNEGFEDGVKAGQQATINMVYASICLALNELYGFSTIRCHRLLERSYQHIITTFDSSEIVDEVYRKIGIEIRLDDPMEPVSVIDKTREAG